MTDVMKGVRILEVAEHMFVPAASAILSDWGADVIKVEHHLRGDAMRGLGSTGVLDLSKGVHVLNEHSNRGKRSIGLDLSSEEGVQVLYELAKTCDVFLTNKLPEVSGEIAHRCATHPQAQSGHYLCARHRLRAQRSRWQSRRL